MQFSEYWLRTFVSPQVDSAALDHLLTMAGLEVEEAAPAAPPFSNIVVGQIVEAEKHPNADKLKVCKVDVGQAEMLQIVCGAPNAVVGIKVPCALVGAILPDDFRIKKAKLRDVESFGMLCSSRELGLSEEHEGLLVLPEHFEIGCDIRDSLKLDDMLFTVKLTPNRADCLSLSGIAREVAAVTGATLNLPEIVPVEVTTSTKRTIILDEPQACPCYCGRVISGVNAKVETPDWMKMRLERSGVRSISALVDITNYVMLELGQPLHAFDNEKLKGAIHIRFPHDRETLILLNQQKVTPDAKTLLIADEQRALALAGIMGGDESGISLETTNVFLESAFFNPDTIAGKAREYGFSTDASHRFERGVDFKLPRKALERATRLILDICGGQAGPVEEAVSVAHLPTRPEVCLKPDRVRRLLGINITDDEMQAILKRDHLTVEQHGEAFLVTPPSFRFDITLEEDLIEELARLYGYDAIPVVPPQGKMVMLDQPERVRSQCRIRHMLAGRGYQEVINFAFVDEGWERDFCANQDPIRLANPIASQMNVMRSSLISGLIANLKTNLKRQQNRVRLFEIGRCFERQSNAIPVDGFNQPVRLAALAYGSVWAEQWGSAERKVDFYDIKGDLEALLVPLQPKFEVFSHPALHPGRAASIIIEGRPIGFIGALHPVWVQRYELGAAPVLFEIDAALTQPMPEYHEISRQPVVIRDLALVVEQALSAECVLETLWQAASEVVREINLFDVYSGQGIEPEKKSLAFRIVMQDASRTLEEAEVEKVVSALVRHVETILGARLR